MRPQNGTTYVGLILLVLALAPGCTRVLGRFQYTSLHSQREGRTLRYAVYVPRDWDHRTPLPLVLLLHGAGDDASSPDRSAVVQRLDEALAAKQIPPFLMVAPDGERGFWVNWHDGSHHYRDWVLEEVLPAVSARYPVIEGARGRHLLGVSMGAGGGMQMWLADPAQFASASLLSAPILDQTGTRAFLRRFIPDAVIARVFGPMRAGDGHDPYTTLMSAEDLRGSKLLFGAALHDHDPILRSQREFSRVLSERAIPHTFITFPGRHGWQAWARVFPYVLCKQLDPACALAPPS